MASRRDPKRVLDDSANGLGDGSREVEEFGGAGPLKSVTYIRAMLKPLIGVARQSGLHSQVYYLEMAAADAADTEHKLRSVAHRPPETPPDPDA